ASSARRRKRRRRPLVIARGCMEASPRAEATCRSKLPDDCTMPPYILSVKRKAFDRSVGSRVGQCLLRHALHELFLRGETLLLPIAARVHGERDERDDDVRNRESDPDPAHSPTGVFRENVRERELKHPLAD